LKTGLAETEVVRRRTPLLVEDAQRDPRLFRPLIELGATPSYVAAPSLWGTGSSVSCTPTVTSPGAR